MASAAAGTIPLLALLGVLAGCAEEQGACIIAAERRGLCVALQPRSACESGKDEYMAAATPAEAVSKCKARGYVHPKGDGSRPLTDQEVEDRLAAGTKVYFSLP